MSEYGPSEAEIFGKNISENHPNSESPTTERSESELLQAMEASDGAQFIFNCLRSEAVTLANDADSSIVVDEDRLRSVMSHHQDRVDHFWNQVDETSIPIELPENLDIDKEARKAMRDALDILYRHSLVEKKWLVEASKIAGPGNTEGVDLKNFAEPGGFTGNRGQFNYGHFYDDLRRQGWNSSQRLPMPHSKANRDQLLRVSLNYEPATLSFVVGGLQDASVAAGEPIATENLITLESLITAAHEYGHALEMAYRVHGSDTLEEARAIDAVPLASVFPYLAQQDIHRELFARTYEQAVLGRALQERFNYTEEQVDAFAAHAFDRDEAKTEAYKALFECVPHLGIEPGDIMQVLYRLQRQVIGLGGPQFAVMVPDLTTMFKYMHKPYTFEQIKAMQPELPDNEGRARRDSN